MDLTSGLAQIKELQAALQVLTALSLTSYQFPQSATITDDLRCDFIIVGAGTAGSVLTNRLSEIPDFEVCVFEAGGDPPLESMFPGLTGYLPFTEHDYNITSVKEPYTDQYLKDGVTWFSYGKMLGGTSSLDHLMFIRGAPHDYSGWGDDVSSWNYETLLPYFTKTEKLEDDEILNSTYAKYHGTEGNLKMKREHSEGNDDFLNAFAELGYNINFDMNNPETILGSTESILTISDGVRQSSATAYLTPILNRSNVHVFKNTKVVQLLIDSNNTATGVKFVTSDGTTSTVNANKEVILSAGAIHSPQLLMLAGIGDKTHLESLNIHVISDVPVGKNLQDNPVALVVYKIYPKNSTSAAWNPNKAPLPAVTTLAALNESQGYADYVSFNMYFAEGSYSNAIQFCSVIMKYVDSVCQKFLDAVHGTDALVVGIAGLHPSSRGYIQLNSTDPADQPLVYLQKYLNPDDLVDMAKYFVHYTEIEKTEYFQSVGAEMVDFDFPECANLTRGSEEFWQCHMLSLSVSIWNYCGTCAIGSVVNDRLNVVGVTGLRVVDASVLPNLAGAKITATVYAVAEKAADMIKLDWSSN